MKAFPPPVLVETWLQLIKSKDKNVSHQQFKSQNKIKEHFGSIELANLYVEQAHDKEIEIYYL